MKNEFTDAFLVKIYGIGITSGITAMSIQQFDLALSIVLKIVTILSLSAGAAISIIKIIRYFKKGTI